MLINSTNSSNWEIVVAVNRTLPKQYSVENLMKIRKLSNRSRGNNSYIIIYVILYKWSVISLQKYFKKYFKMWKKNTE